MSFVTLEEYIGIVKKVKSDFEQYVFTYTSAISALQDIYMYALSAEMDTAPLNDLINTISTGPSLARPDSVLKLNRLMRSIYSLPCNAISYEDNGRLTIDETIYRLKFDHPSDADELEEISSCYDGSDGWFRSLAAIRMKLINKLHPKKELYLSQEHRDMIISNL